jgi:transposase-like protein
MAIVHTGSVPLQVPISGSRGFIMELVEQIRSAIPGIAQRFLEESLEVEVNRLLERNRYVRRRQAKRKETGVYCSKCRSHQCQNFRRNGHYQRQLAIQWGRVKVNVPQVKCQCGGNVRLRYQTIRARQRIWDDLELEIQVEYGRGLSYRQIKVDFDQRLQSSVGLRTLNRCVLQQGTCEGSCALLKKGEVPPIIRVDGIWMTVMFATGETKTDQAGRKRAEKRARKVPILAAQGVWPITGRTQLLAWMRADGEDAASWQKFLELLFEAGITSENGLVMLASDGSTGFRTAYENVYWNVPLQRCVFHKLRNIAQSVHVPAELDRQAAHEFRTEFLRSAAHIWQASDEREARLIYSAFCETWQSQQAKAIRTLTRDFEDTLTFFAIQELATLRGEQWPAHLLRTTSPLERMFREFRQRYRKAILFHSTTGLQAVTAQLSHRFS